MQQSHRYNFHRVLPLWLNFWHTKHRCSLLLEGFERQNQTNCFLSPCLPVTSHRSLWRHRPNGVISFGDVATQSPTVWKWLSLIRRQPLRCHCLLPTAKEGNVFTGVCQSFCSQPASWLLGHCSSLLRRGRYASYWNAFLQFSYIFMYIFCTCTWWINAPETNHKHQSYEHQHQNHGDHNHLRRELKWLQLFCGFWTPQFEVEFPARGWVSGHLRTLIWRCPTKNIIVFIQVLYANRPYFHKEPGWKQ